MKLDPEQKDMIEKLGEKLVKDIELSSLHVNTKAHRKAGNRFNYATQVRAEADGKVYSIDSQGWEFKVTVHESFDKLKKELLSKKKKKSIMNRLFRR